MNKKQNQIRARLGAMVRHHPENLEAIEALERELKGSLAADYVRDVSTELTPPQRRELVSILVAPAGDQA